LDRVFKDAIPRLAKKTEKKKDIKKKSVMNYNRKKANNYFYLQFN